MLPISLSVVRRELKPGRGEFRSLVAARRNENARVKTLPGFVTRFDPLTLAYANATGVAVTRGWRYFNCARSTETTERAGRAVRNILNVTRVAELFRALRYMQVLSSDLIDMNIH